MKNHTNHNLTICSTIVMAVALAIASPIQAQTAEPKAKEEQMMKDEKMRECCQEMKEQKEKMMAEIKAQDAALTAQVAAMNNAPDDKKLNLMAGIITLMVEQRAARDAHMEKMHGGMTKHMMGHMRGGRECMSECPMMKDMKDMKEMNGKPEDVKKPE